MGELTALRTVLLWGVASAAACVVGVASGVSPIKWIASERTMWLARNLWNSGRWLVGASLVFWFINWGAIPIVAIFAGSAPTGILRALQNLFNPVGQLNAALSLPFIPRAAEFVAKSARYRVRHVSLYAGIIFFLISVSYSSLLLAAPKNLLMVLYKKIEIVDAAYLLWPLALVTILDSITTGVGIGLYAVGRMKVFFYARLAGGFIFLLGTVILSPTMGVAGIVWAMAASNAVISLIVALALLEATDS
jgi:O-antigen/teichoic acid export membrane protein